MSDATKFEPLEKDQPKELNDGDFISFLPNDVVFQVLRKDKGDHSEIESEVREEVKCETKEELKSGKKEEQKNETNEGLEKGNIEEKDGNNVPVIECEKEEETEVVHPLEKTRILPSWMTNKKGLLEEQVLMACILKAYLTLTGCSFFGIYWVLQTKEYNVLEKLFPKQFFSWVSRYFVLFHMQIALVDLTHA